nr:MAG TPA: hypothetical protein [Bacteriophage sp.]
MSRTRVLNNEEYQYLKSINDTVYQNLNETLKLLEKSNELMDHCNIRALECSAIYDRISRGICGVKMAMIHSEDFSEEIESRKVTKEGFY